MIKKQSLNITRCDVLVIGAGVVGISIGIALLNSYPNLKVVIAEKEKEVGKHASGRNSGVIHAGFYYSPESLKARFCREGNSAIRSLAKDHGVPLKTTGKVVVTQNPDEVENLIALYERGLTNGVDLELLDASKLRLFEPLASTFDRFIWSPTTAVSNPVAILSALCKEFLGLGGRIDYSKQIKLTEMHGEIVDSYGNYEATYFINAAGSNADYISRNVAVGLEYAMLPFLGLYQGTSVQNLPLKTLVYPVPHKVNPFLGVHFTLTTTGVVKVGPTAIPVLGRQQYSMIKGWSLKDIMEASKASSTMLRKDKTTLFNLVRTEYPYFVKSNLIRAATKLVPGASSVSNWSPLKAGIRAQLVHLPTGRLVNDFLVLKHLNSTHVLNAVSPGWTSALPFGKYIAENIKLT